MQETWVRSLVREDLLKKEMATHSSILAWKNPINRGAKRATVYGVAESDTTERLSTNMPFYMRDFLLRFWYLWGFWSQTPRIQGTTVSNTWPYIYVLNFLFEIISKLQKSCSNNTKNPHTVFIQINQILTLIHMCYIIHSLFIYNC